MVYKNSFYLYIQASPQLDIDVYFKIQDKKLNKPASGIYLPVL
jgi:hypothetical protein